MGAMPILPRYLFRQYAPVFLLCVTVCTAVLLMNHFLKLFNLAVMKGISPLWILSCFAMLLPYFFSLALPMAFLVALLLTLGSMSESGEIMALRSSGFSFKDILWPFFSLAVALSALLLFVNHKASPESFHAFKMSYEQALAQVSRVEIEPGVFTVFGDWQLFAKSANSENGRLEGVYLVKLKDPQQGLRVDAPRGLAKMEKGRGFALELFNGTLQLPSVDPLRYATAQFKSYRLFVPLITRKVQRDPDIQEMNTGTLFKKLKDPAVDDSHRKEYRTEAALRSAGAMTPFVFFWIGCPLGLILEKHARARGFAWSLGVLLGYYGLLALGIGLGRRHYHLSPIGPWIPIAAGLLTGGYFWKKNLAR